MMPVIASLTVLTAAGVVPALALTRSIVYAVPLGPIVGALLLWVAAQIDFLTSLGWNLTALTMIVVANLAGAASMLVDRSSTWSTIRRRTAGWDTGLAALVASILPWTMIRRAPVDWDTRSIWFFQAEWIAAGGTDASDAISNRAFLFSHPDYPKLGPSAIAGVWRLVDSRSAEVAQAAVSVLVVAAVVVIGVTVGVCLRHVTAATRRGRWVIVVAVGLWSLAFYGASRSWSFNGYMDSLWAALIIGASAATLTCTDSRTVIAGIALAAAAAATKNEAMIPVVVLTVMVIARHRADRRTVTVALLPVGLIAVWWTVRRALGVPSTYGNREFRRIASDLEPGDIADIGQNLVLFAGGPAVAFGAIALIGGRWLRDRRADLGLGSMTPTVVLAATSLLSLVAALVIVDPGRYRLIAERTTVVAVGLLLFDMCLSLIAATVDPARDESVGSGRAPDTADDRRTSTSGLAH